MTEAIITAYNEAIVDTDRNRAMRVVHDAESGGVTPEEIVFDLVLPAMERMVDGVSRGLGISLAQHFMTAQIAEAVTTEMIGKFKKAPKARGHVVIGTTAGDMHSLGKKIVIGCLRARLIDVKDLGLNVAADRFVDEAVAIGAEVIAISAMMMHTARSDAGCLRVREILREKGLQDALKVVVGGAPFRFDTELYRTVGADACAPDAIAGGRIIQEIIREVKK